MKPPFVGDADKENPSDQWMRPLVTVGLCVKNAEDTVGITLESIFRQDYVREFLEILVVDGGSQDATLPIVRDHMSKAGIRWRLYFDNGEGLGYARQTVVRHAHGKYILFVDSDVIIQDDFLCRQVEFMERHHQVGIGLGHYVYEDRQNWISASWNLYHSMGRDFVGCAFICRRDVILSLGGFDVRFKRASEDRDMIVRLKAYGWSTATIENARFYHRFRRTLKAFWSEQRWFGYGSYQLALKHCLFRDIARNIPLGKLVHGLKTASEAYRLSHRRISFLIPVLLVFGNVAWWFGVLQAAMQGVRK